MSIQKLTHNEIRRFERASRNGQKADEHTANVSTHRSKHRYSNDPRHIARKYNAVCKKDKYWDKINSRYGVSWHDVKKELEAEEQAENEKIAAEKQAASAKLAAKQREAKKRKEERDWAELYEKSFGSKEFLQKYYEVESGEEENDEYEYVG